MVFGISMIKRIVLAAGLLVGVSVPAFAQCTGSFPANTFCGSLTGGIPGPRAVPAGAISMAGGTVLGNVGTTTGPGADTRAPVFGLNGTAAGTLTLRGSTSGAVTIQPGDAAAGTYIFALPTSAGTAGLPLLSGGGGGNPQLYQILGLPAGGTNAALTASNGGLVYSTNNEMAILAGTASANRIPLSGALAAPSWSTATYPATAAQGTLLAAGTANQISATANPTLGLAGTVSGTITLSGVTSGGAVIRPQDAAGTPQLFLPNTSGTFAAGATSPLVLNTTTGVLTCPTCLANTPAGLTRVDDTNVTVTLGGTPATALLQPVSLTLGWTGTLAAARLNANVVQAITNDTNVTGSIAAQNLTLGWTGQLAIGRGGTGQATAQAARAGSGLNIDQMSTTGDANVAIAATTRTQATSATLTAPRTWTLPAANALTAGQTLLVADTFGAINGSNTITVQRAGADTINGASTTVLGSQYSQVTLVSDGVSRWNFFSAAGSSVTSVFGRTGAVIAVAGDYDAPKITYDPPGLGSVTSTVQTRLETEIQLIDFWTGTADDTADFNAALDYAQGLPGGGTVTFCKNPANNHWRITGTISVTGTKVHLKGCGRGSTLILDGAGQIVIGGDTGNVTFHSGISNFVIAVTPGTWVGPSATVQLINTSRAFVRDINWFGWTRVAIRNGLLAANSSASGTQFSNLVGVNSDATATHAIQFSSQDNTGDFNINGINFNGGGVGAGGALISMGGSGSAQIDGLNMSNFLGTNFDYGILAAIESGGGMYTHNYSNGTFDTGLTTNGNVYFLQSGGTIQNINFTNVNFSSSTAVAGRNFTLSSSGGTAEAITISGSALYDSGGHGIVLDQSGAAVMRGISITGNVIKDGGRTAANTFDAILASGNISGLAITGNSVFNGSTTWRFGINLVSLNSANVPSVTGNNLNQTATAGFSLATAQERMSGITGNIGTVSGADGGNPQLIQAWAVYTSNTPTLLDSYNITSLSKQATGDVIINLANSVAGSNVGTSCSAVDSQAYFAAPPASGSARIRTAAVGTTTLIDTHVTCMFYGRRAN
jgi:hypothetical protein